MSRPAIGVEIGGTKLQACLGETSGAVGHTLRGRVPDGADANGILGWFESVIPELFAFSKKNDIENPRCIGVGFGGPVDCVDGTVLVSHQVEGWNGFPLRAWFEERFHLPTGIENDSNAAGWAEYCLGAGRGTRHFMYMNIGSGIGGALVIDGRLHNGQGQGAGELGHTYVADWTATSPGAMDKLEHLCSGWAIERRIRRAPAVCDSAALMALCGGNAETLTCAMLGEAARAGDGYAQAELRHVADALGAAIANVIALVHPERIAIGGGVGMLGETLLAPLRESVEARAFDAFSGRYEIVPCALKEAVVLAGALLRA